MYNEKKNTAAAWWIVTIEDVWSVCVCIFCTAAGGQIGCSSLFGGREGLGEWNNCGKIFIHNS